MFSLGVIAPVFKKLGSNNNRPDFYQDFFLPISKKESPAKAPA
jgi:hypothetical protein